MAQTNSNASPSGGGIQVIARAATILRLLESHPEGLSLGAIAKSVALPRSTVQRIVGALSAERLVVSGESGRGVRLGPGLVSLGSAARSHFHGIIRPHLRALSDELKETVDLSIRDGHVAVFIDQAVSEERQLRAISGMGVSFPLHCCANGKALLAGLDAAALERLLPRLDLVSLTPNTITSKQRLLKELDVIRQQGVAYDREEQSAGICAVGAVFDDPFGGQLAISVVAPSARFYGNEPGLVKALLACRERVEADLARISRPE
ncbi:MAG TPA: IclR family transcriptional regulator [Gammaproteobacteria bacterium]